MTSNNLKDITGDPSGATSTAVEEGIKANNRHIRYLNFDDHGYSVLDVNAERAQMDWFIIGDRADRDTGATWETSWRTRSGTSRIEQVDHPLGGTPMSPRLTRRTLVTTSAGAVFATALLPERVRAAAARGRKRAYVLVVDGCKPDEIDADADPDPRRRSATAASNHPGAPGRCRSWRPSPTT